MQIERRGSVTILLVILAAMIVGVAGQSTYAYSYQWYRSTGYHYYSSYFPYRYVFYTAPYYYYVQDTYGNLASQIQTLQSQLQASQSQKDQALAQAQQLTAQVESMRNEVSGLKTQMDNIKAQYASQLSDMRSMNQALQANLDAVRTQNNVMLVIIVLLGACVVGLGLILSRKH
ncbi:MAG: hypothetical protein V1857_05660 [archaeon]